MHYLFIFFFFLTIDLIGLTIFSNNQVGKSPLYNWSVKNTKPATCNFLVFANPIINFSSRSCQDDDGSFAALASALLDIFPQNPLNSLRRKKKLTWKQPQLHFHYILLQYYRDFDFGRRRNKRIFNVDITTTNDHIYLIKNLPGERTYVFLIE